MHQLTKAEISAKIFALRKYDIQNFHTNYFMAPLDENILCFENEQAIIFFQPEDDFLHLYFAANSLKALNNLFAAYKTEKDTAVEIICKNAITQDLFMCVNQYFPYQTTYHRTKLYKIDERPCKIPPQYADLNDVDFIHDSLRTAFNKYFDHFPSKATLTEYIHKKQVMVKKEKNHIAGYLVFTITNFACHFNYMQNLSDDSFLQIALIDQFYNEIILRGAKNVYLWVDVDNNLRVKKLHEFYGHRFDGTLNVAFLAKRI